MPVPFILLLYGIDGLILPCLYFGGEHLPFAIGTSAIAGLFLAGAAHDRREGRRGLRVTAFITNLLCAAAAFFLMFGLHQWGGASAEHGRVDGRSSIVDRG